MRALFRPILAGATLPDRLVACLGALLGIALTVLTCAGLGLSLADAPAVAAPIGASAVLVFAVPASPLAQPWPVVGGNVLSALVGVALVRVLGPTPLAAGLAVAGAIGVMSLARCLHPPGGAAALTAVIGGPAVTGAGWLFALAPVGINAVLLAAIGWCFHRLSGHRYPHRSIPAPIRAAFLPEDLDRALAAEGEAFDIAREDLERLLARVEAEAALRRAQPVPSRRAP